VPARQAGLRSQPRARSVYRCSATQILRRPSPGQIGLLNDLWGGEFGTELSPAPPSKLARGRARCQVNAGPSGKSTLVEQIYGQTLRQTVLVDDHMAARSRPMLLAARIYRSATRSPQILFGRIYAMGSVSMEGIESTMAPVANTQPTLYKATPSPEPSCTKMWCQGIDFGDN